MCCDGGNQRTNIFSEQSPAREPGYRTTNVDFCLDDSEAANIYKKVPLFHMGHSGKINLK